MMMSFICSFRNKQDDGERRVSFNLVEMDSLMMMSFICCFTNKNDMCPITGEILLDLVVSSELRAPIR
jgi:hypothetical protein